MYNLVVFSLNRKKKNAVLTLWKSLRVTSYTTSLSGPILYCALPSLPKPYLQEKKNYEKSVGKTEKSHMWHVLEKIPCMLHSSKFIFIYFIDIQYFTSSKCKSKRNMFTGAKVRKKNTWRTCFNYSNTIRIIIIKETRLTALNCQKHILLTWIKWLYPLRHKRKSSTDKSCQ